MLKHYKSNLARTALLSAVIWGMAACTTVNNTNPARSAVEELLISTAADRAAASLVMNIPKDTPVFLDSSSFDGTDNKYAIAVIRAAILRQGARTVDDKKNAKMVVLARVGALSTNQKQFLVGISSFNVPIPLASTPFTFPEIALYSDEEQKGVAKFEVSIYDAKNGKLVSEPRPQFGYAHNDKETAVFFFSWRSEDVMPKDGDTIDNEGNIIKHEDK